MVAIPDAPELHIPPVVLFVKLDVEPTHVAVAPVIGDGNELIVTVFAVAHPVGKV